MSIQTLSNHIKNNTQLLHRRVEKPLAKRLFSPDFNLDQYSEILDAFLVLHRHFEQQIKKFHRVEALLRNRSKILWLEADLAALRQLGANSVVTPFAELTPLSSTEEAFGALYVLEGSTMGGQIISQQLAKHSFIDQKKHLRFFNSYENQVHLMWQELLSALNDYGSSREHSFHEVSVGAEIVFRNFELVFSNVWKSQELQIDRYAG